MAVAALSRELGVKDDVPIDSRTNMFVKVNSKWQSLFLSFWSKDFYLEVANSWQGLGLSYLLLLVCFTSIFFAAKLELEFNLKVDRFFMPMLSQLPKMTIHDGQLSIDRPSPYVIQSPFKDLIIAFDTRPKPMTFQDSKANFLVTADAVFYMPEGAGNPNIPLAGLSNGEIDSKSIVNILGQLRAWMFVGVYITAVLINFMELAVLSVLYGFIARFINSETGMSYKQRVRLAAVSATPAQLMHCFLVLQDANLESWRWLETLLWFSYYFFALKTNADANRNSNSVDRSGSKS